jgi:quaternary ammonium compound-resistance protein SugE
MHWVHLFIAGIFEVVWAVSLKVSDGFTRLVPSLVTVAAMILSFLFLARALRSLPLGTAYAVWTGIGAVGTAIIGMMFFGDSHDWMRICCILLIVLGIIGLKLVS